jgi:CDP-diacylglycerol--glycerol-3-phosphate 3-phosphatidyltransferase
MDNGLLFRNIPNALSSYRLVMAPVISVLAFVGQENLFVVLIIISLITDVLDGLIARAFQLQSAFGAKLDSIADDATYVAAIIGVFVFKSSDIGIHLPMLYIFIIMLALSTIVHLLKFGRFPSLHLYSFRIGGYLQGGFLIFLFLVGFQVHLYYFVLLFGVIASLEVIVVTLLIRSPISNARGLYWVLRDKYRGLGRSS